MRPQDEPRDRAVRVRVIASVKTSELESTQHYRDDSASDYHHQPPSDARRFGVRERQLRGVPHRANTEDLKNDVGGRNAKLGQQRPWRRPRVEIAADVV